MDKGLMIKELAEKLEVTEDTVINWEIRGRKLWSLYCSASGYYSSFLGKR